MSIKFILLFYYSFVLLFDILNKEYSDIGSLSFLVMVGWNGKVAVKDGVVAFSCLLNCLKVSLLRFSSFCLTLSMMRLIDC